MDSIPQPSHPRPPPMRPLSRGTSGFRPLSRTQSTVQHPQERLQKSQDTMLLAQLLVSKEFGAPPESKKPEKEEPEQNEDEIEGDEFDKEEDVNYQNVFGLDEDKLAAEGYELQKKKVGVEFNELPPARFGTKNKKAAPRWTQEDTDLFYKYLKMCGTDFSMISKFFPGRTRKMIVNKFHCEEKKGKREFLDALNNPMSLDVATFSQINGVNEKDLVDDFLKNKDRLLSGLPLKRPIPEHEDAISGSDDFEDVESDNDDKQKQNNEDNEEQSLKSTHKHKETAQTKETPKESTNKAPQTTHDDDEIDGDDNFDSD